jgi:hypothetical protein
LYHLVFCCLVLLPYISLGWRFPSQVQPWAAVVGWLGLFLLYLTGKRWQFSRSDLVIMAMALFMTIYLRDVAHMDWGAYIRRSLGIAFSIGVFYFGKTVTPRQLTLAVLIASAAYLGFAILQHVAPGVYEAIAVHLVPDKNLEAYKGERGVESLTPEATDFGFTAVYLALFAILAEQAPANEQQALPRLWTRCGALGGVLCAALSQSASSVFAGVAVAAALAGRKIWTPTRLLIAGGLAALVVLLALTPAVQNGLTEIRGARLLMTALTNPAELLKTSFVHRYVHNVVGVYGFLDSYGLGYGAGSFTRYAPGIYLDHGVGADIDMTEYHKHAVKESLAEAPLGVFPMLLLEYGALGLVFVMAPAWIVYRSKISAKGAVVVVLALTWLQSFPIAYPPFWLLLALTDNDRFNRGGPTAALPRSDQRPVATRSSRLAGQTDATASPMLQESAKLQADPDRAKPAEPVD